MPCAWLAAFVDPLAAVDALAVAGVVDTCEELDASFLCCVFPELPLRLDCTISSLTCSSFNSNNDCENNSNDNDNNITHNNGDDDNNSNNNNNNNNYYFQFLSVNHCWSKFC